jgi:hypothetical protein
MSENRECIKGLPREAHHLRDRVRGIGDLLSSAIILRRHHQHQFLNIPLT